MSFNNPGAGPDAAAAAADIESAFEVAPTAMLIVAADAPTFTVLAVNAAHRQAFATTPALLLGKGLFNAFPEPVDDTTAAFMNVIRSSFNRAIESGAPDEMGVMPYVVMDQGKASHRFWTATHTPLKAASGEVVRILSTVRDVTSEVNEERISEARALLMREVDHRARNALTVVQAIVRLTEAADLAAYKEVVLGRVDALARAQTSLASRKWEGAVLAELVEAELSALVPVTKIRMSGPEVLLPAEKVQAMSMLLHELATNALKHGALSAPSGEVHVTWSAVEGGVSLVWREQGGPAVAAPSRSGFGSRLLGQLAHQLGGAPDFDWQESGLTFQVSAGG